ncbi:MAG: aldehyde dehydrogenase family protein [Gemmatimonadota bacterium]|nr:aldehyde dehydrogenase family protein [Gemmatimonadota bacterium]
MSEITELFETLDYGPAPEAAGPVEEWLDRHGRRFAHWVGGAWRDPADGERFETANPASGAPLAEVAQGAGPDVDAAVAAAREAWPAWRDLSGHARARHLYAIARRLQRDARFFSVLETMDNGKPIREARDIDIPLVARHFYHHAGWAQLRESEMPGQVPLGVVGQIIPWNFPLLMLAWKVAPALAAGNTVVLKPAEFTSLSALAFAELTKAVGLPDGVFNVVTGDGRTGAALASHPDVDKIAFTGSTDVGRILRDATAGSGKKLSLELGGKSPFLVYDDADLDSVVEGVVDAIWFNQGQVCCAGSRILVQEGVAGRLVDKLKARMETLRVGDPLDKAVDIGAIVAPVQLERIRTLVEKGREEGAELWQPSWSCPEDGWFYPPTLLTGVEPASTVARVEIFGPVVALMTFRTPDESVALANDTRYGLAASIWTENINLALDIAPKVKAGTVWINCTNMFDAASGFGGYRESGFGREGGLEGMWEYVRPAWEERAKGAAGAAGPMVAGKAYDAVAGSIRPAAPASPAAEDGRPAGAAPPIDRTAKMYVGGKQARPDAPYTVEVRAPDGALVGEVGRGNRKDIRNAVEAARKAQAKWAADTAHNRAQVLFYLAENLAARRAEFAARIDAMTGRGREPAEAEVEASLARLFLYAGLADKWDGRVHHTPFRNVTLAMPEPIGVMGVACPDAWPLLGFVSTVIPPVAMGNAVVAVPSETAPLAATDLYQVLDTSDVPGGVINIVTGGRDELAQVLAAHDDVDGLWYFGTREGGAAVERLSAGNMKRTWTDLDLPRDWTDPVQGEGHEFLRRCTQVKNIWVPYGE